MLIAHISDFHIATHLPDTGLVRTDVADCARRIVADINAFSPAIDAVMLTGDVTDGGTDEDYALLAGILAPLKMPVFPIAGNHDSRDGFRRAHEGQLPFARAGALDYEGRVGDVRVLTLDSLIEGKVEGELSDATLDWLEARLAEPHDGPTFLLIHHPPFLSGIHGLDVMSLTGGGERLARLVRACPGDLTLLSGHIHRAYQGIWQGRLCAVGGSPAFQIAPDLTPGAEPPPLVDESYGYFIHRLEDGYHSVLRRELPL